MNRPSLLPPNATKFEQALEEAFFPTEADDFFGFDVDNFLNPDETDESVLPYLAFGLKVDIWEPDNPRFQKREAIKKWHKVRRLRGTAYSLRTALGLSGLNATITEWYQRGRDPYTFTVNIDFPRDGEVTQANIDLIRRITKALKPLRTREDVAFRVAFRLRVRVGLGNKRTIYHNRSLEVENA